MIESLSLSLQQCHAKRKIKESTDWSTTFGDGNKAFIYGKWSIFSFGIP